jgi:polyphenol oxidase
MPTYKLEKKMGVFFWRIQGFEKFGCQGVFFLRHGGKSRGKYSSLNLGLNTDDNPQIVRYNRKLAVKAAGFGPLLPVLGQQVHGNKIRVVKKTDAGKGWNNFSDAFLKTDALITNISGLPIAVAAADCLPILLIAEKKQGVAVIHAGWRGIASGIIGKTIVKLQQSFNIKSKNIWAAIGPGIGPKAFEIKENTVKILSKFDPLGIIYQKKSGKYYYNLYQTVQNQLMIFGVSANKIITIQDCTASYPKKYFSYRRDGKTGRMLGIIQINP